jgi:putative spermidine/putrescine transport system substrate-binding protein
MNDSSSNSADSGRRGITRRELLRRSAYGVGGVMAFGSVAGFLEACGSSSSSTSSSAASATPTALPTALGSGGMAALQSAAKAEGRLNTIALPPNWANYGQIISTYQSKYGIPITNAAPNDTSSQENQAIVSLKGQSRAPDVVDDGVSFLVDGKSKGLFAPYKVATWDTIPTAMKDPDGYWYGDYYGVISFGTNLNVQKTPPKSWDDLLSPIYKGQVAIDGDPRSAGDAFAAVFSAALANGGSLDDIEPGINFFAKLKKAGNFIPADALPANIAKGSTPIAIIWDYLNLANKVSFKNNPPYEVSVPTTGVYGAYYGQAVSAYAPHPMAARLWEEFIYSDQGQLLYLAGFTHPARYADLAARNVIPPALAAALPPASSYQNLQFASQAQLAAAATVLTQQWGPKVAGS